MIATQNSACIAKLIASTIRANHPPEVPTILLFQAKLAPRAELMTDISSSAWRKFTFFDLMISVSTVDAGVIGYAA
jgi:hypothetical protein